VLLPLLTNLEMFAAPMSVGESGDLSYGVQAGAGTYSYPVQPALAGPSYGVQPGSATYRYDENGDQV
jgi:hypothetical protein